jgi:hypothetical protein
MTAAEVVAYAERAFSLHSEHGVCAGPKVMIEEFLSVIIDGCTPRDGLPEMLDDELRAAVEDIDSALDYAMLGLQAYAAVFSLWPMTMRTYEALHAIAQAWVQVEPSVAVQGVQQWLQPIIQRLRTSTHLATEAWRADREFVYGDMFAQCGAAVRGQAAPPALADLLAPRRVAADEAPVRALREALLRHFGPAADAAGRRFRAQWIDCLLQHFTRAQAVVRTACDVQRRTNRLLGRAQPAQRFVAADIDIYVQLVGMTDGRVPFLLSELRNVFGIAVDIDAQSLEIEELRVPA